MKKRYRIGICLTLIICLLLLSACGSKRGASAKNPAQTADKAGETTATQPSQNPTETNGTESNAVPEDNKNDLPELTFNWKESYLRIYPAANVSHIQSGKLVTYAEIQDEIDHIVLLSQYSESYIDEETVRNLPYTETFFADNSLLLIGLPNLSAAEMTDVTYSDGVITCAITKTWNKEYDDEDTVIGGINPYYCFIEIDTVLPEGTQIVIEVTNEFVGESALAEKYKIFNEKVI